MRIVLVEDEPKSREGIVKIIQHYTEPVSYTHLTLPTICSV